MLVKDPPCNWYFPRGCYIDAVEGKKLQVEGSISLEQEELMDGMLQLMQCKRKTAHELSVGLLERLGVSEDGRAWTLRLLSHFGLGWLSTTLGSYMEYSAGCRGNPACHDN